MRFQGISAPDMRATSLISRVQWQVGPRHAACFCLNLFAADGGMFHAQMSGFSEPGCRKQLWQEQDTDLSLVSRVPNFEIMPWLGPTHEVDKLGERVVLHLRG